MIVGPDSLADITEDRPVERTWTNAQVAGNIIGGVDITEAWERDGFVVLPGLLSDRRGSDEIERYSVEWIVAHQRLEHVGKLAPFGSFLGGDEQRPVLDRRDFVLRYEAPADGLGWASCTAYVDHPALRALCCDAMLANVLRALLGAPAGVHLNLTGWVSTERDWHQDAYLNPPEVGDRYAAVWIALDDIDERSGPFECVPGSHRWPVITQEKIGRYVDLSDPDWPKHTEQFLTPLFEREVGRRMMDEAVRDPTYRHVPKRGDVLIWHPRLWHRGSPPQVPGLERRALIAHYSTQRADMPAMVGHVNGGWFYPLPPQ